MNATRKINMLRKIVSKIHIIEDDKKEKNAEKTSLNKRLESLIMEGYEMRTLQKTYSEILKLESEVKLLNQSVSALRKNVDAIILDEDNYYEDQMTIEDIEAD